MKCYCCSGESFENCCQPYLLGHILPPTAEALMRSRYTAYATAKVPYLLETTHRSTRSYYNTADILQWAQASTWQKLEIISKQAGTPTDTQGKVEFKAYYLDDQKTPQIHHERSSFKKENGRWFFVDGKVS